MCNECATLLSQGLDLCVRARKLDAIDRTRAQMALTERSDPVDAKEWWTQNIDRRMATHNEMWPDQPMSRSATYPMWVQDQYEKDLADWERRSRHHLQQGCASKVAG